MSVDFPLRVGGDGRIAVTAGDDHVRDMVLQVLLTAPGERVNRPDFGCGLGELLFEPLSEFLVGATELAIRTALQRWLGDLVDTLAVTVSAEDSRLVVDLQYARRADGGIVDERFHLPREAS